MKRLRIGLVGENANDTKAIRLLLERMIDVPCEFRQLFRNATGSLLDQAGGATRLRRDYELFQPDLVVFIRDLDALEDDKEALRKRQDFFRRRNRTVDRKGIFMLHIWEIEALILADVEYFNEKFETNLPQVGDVMRIVCPKEYLQTVARYRESHCPELLGKADLEKMSLHCRYFQRFGDRLQERLQRLVG